MHQDIERLAAFDDLGEGGNPAGVWIGAALPPAVEMAAIAREVGFSETVFAAPEGEGWRVRYFSPASEVPFCGRGSARWGAAAGSAAIPTHPQQPGTGRAGRCGARTVRLRAR
jgi:PhzF family phenazine biosynthesis protein